MLNAKSVGFYFLFRIIQNNHFLHNYSKIEKIFVVGGICGDASNFDTISKNCPEMFMDKSFVVVVQRRFGCIMPTLAIFFCIIYCQQEGIPKINPSTCPGCVAC